MEGSAFLLHSAVQQGVRQSQQSWNASTKTFVLPPKSEMKWAGEVNGKWEEGDKTGNSQRKKYSFNDGISDFIKGVVDPSEWSKEAVGSILDKTVKKVFKEGKNIGKSWAAKLQPKSSLGTFVKDTLKPRKWLTGKLKGLSSTVSTKIGYIAKYGGLALIAVGAYQEVTGHYKQYKNMGRAISYGTVATGVGFVAGQVGAAIGGSIATGLGLASTGVVAGFIAPIVGAVVVGAAAAVAAKALYSNVKPFKQVVDGVGDKINKLGSAISGSFNTLKGAFGW